MNEGEVGGSGMRRERVRRGKKGRKAVVEETERGGKRKGRGERLKQANRG